MRINAKERATMYVHMAIKLCGSRSIVYVAPVGTQLILRPEAISIKQTTIN